jgi:hypothetical protein
MNYPFCLFVGNVTLPMIRLARAVLVSVGSALRGFKVLTWIPDDWPGRCSQSHDNVSQRALLASGDWTSHPSGDL